MYRKMLNRKVISIYLYVSTFVILNLYRYISDIANSYRSIAYIGNAYRYISVNRGTYHGLDQDAHLPVCDAYIIILQTILLTNHERY